MQILLFDIAFVNLHPTWMELDINLGKGKEDEDDDPTWSWGDN